MIPTKTIGVLGGMGPQASAAFYLQLIKQSAKKYGATQDRDYPRIMLYNLPMEGFVETGVKDHNEVLNQLFTGSQKLEKLGSDFIVMVCNTVHLYHSLIQRVLKVRLLNIIDETILKVEEEGLKKVGILSSETTRDLKLYESRLSTKGISSIVTSNAEQNLINQIILKVMSDNLTENDIRDYNSLIQNQIQQGAEGIILGCTELPLVPLEEHRVQIFNSNNIMAEKALEIAYNVDSQ